MRRLALAVACGLIVAGGASSGLAQSVAATFDPALATPRCAGFASECDSGALLVGRGPAGPEPNAPNTTGSTCQDGGVDGDLFHLYTPSMDQLRVFTSDGGRLALGKPVQIEATLFAGYVAYAGEEVLDVFETDDSVMPPVWRHIGWAMPYEPGFHTYTFSYTPTGTSLNRAVRAAYRTGGYSSTLPCGSSVVDDHDDLWFRVDSAAGTHALVVALTASADAAGAIHVLSGGSGDCEVESGGSTECVFEIADGESVVLGAAADEGAEFLGWSRACSGTDTCSLSMDAPHEVGASFGPQELEGVWVNVASLNEGSGAVAVGALGGQCVGNPSATCEYQVPVGTEVQLTALPAEGSAFVGWDTPWDPSLCDSSPTCSFTVEESHASPFYSPVATFQGVEEVTIEVSSFNGATGVVHVDPGDIDCSLAQSPCTVSVPVGTYLGMDAEAQGANPYSYWTAPASCVDPNGPMRECTFLVTRSGEHSAHAVLAEATEVRLAITSDNDGDGSVSDSEGHACSGLWAPCSYYAQIGQAFTMTAEPLGSSRFVSWLAPEECSGSSEPTCSFTVDEEDGGLIDVIASFEQIEDLVVDVTSLDGGWGAVEIAPLGASCTPAEGRCVYTVPTGSELYVSVVPDDASVLWSSECTGVGPSPPPPGVTCAILPYAGGDWVKVSIRSREGMSWRRASGVVDTGPNGLGSLLTAPDGLSWDAGAVSRKVLASGDGFVELTLENGPQEVAVGLSHGDGGVDLSDIDFALVHEVYSSEVHVYESGVDRGVVSVGDSTLRIEVKDGEVKYVRPGGGEGAPDTVLYTSTVPPTYPLLVDTSFYTSGWVSAMLGGVMVADAVRWTGAAGVTASGDDLVRTSGSGWNAGAASTRAIVSGDGWAEYTVGDAGASVAFGLSHPNDDPRLSSIDLALVCEGGVLSVYEGGVSQGTFGACAAGDRLRVGVAGEMVRYSRNGTAVSTRAGAPTYPLVADASMGGPATLSDAVLGGRTAYLVSWTGVVGASASGATLTRDAGSGWTAGGVSREALGARGGYAEYTVVSAGAAQAFGLSHGDSDQSLADIDFGLETDPASGEIKVIEGGTVVATSSGFAAGDVLRVEVWGQTADYSQNGTLLFHHEGVTPTFPLLVDASLYDSGAALGNARIVGDVVEAPEWTHAVDVAAPGIDLVRPSGQGWDAGAVSRRGLDYGDGGVTFRVVDLGSTLAVGLSHGDSDASREDIDFGILTDAAQNRLAVVEGGVERSSSNGYAVGDVLRVAVEGGAVRYYQNATLLYESVTPPSYPLIVDASLFSTGAAAGWPLLSGELEDVIVPPAFMPTLHIQDAEATEGPDGTSTMTFTVTLEGGD